MLKRHLLGTTVVAGFAALGAMSIAPAAYAQSDETKPAEASDPADQTNVDELVVVGSRLRRDTFNSPSPVQVVTREETIMAGYASATAALQGTAVTGGGAQINNAYGGFVTNGGPGANTIGLRGLGAGRTLVLINGRRVSPAGTRGSVGSADLNVLPNAMIDRVEILRDGASSIYGSDAVAGVVNVMTRKTVDGLEFEGQYNMPAHDGGDESRFSIVGGTHGDNWRMSGSFEHYERSDLTLADREWTRCNRDMILKNSNVPASLRETIDPVTGKEKCYPITATGSNGVTINTLGTSNLTGVAGPGATGTTFNRWRPNTAVTTGLAGWEGVGGGTTTNTNIRDTFDPRTLNRSLISPVQIDTVFAQASYDLHALGDAEVYGELLINQRDSQQTGYRQLSLDYLKGSLLIPTNLQGSTLASGPTNTFSGIFPGRDIGVRSFIGFGNDKSSQGVDFTKVTAGIRGDFFLPDWRYDVNVTSSRSDSTYSQQSWITPRLGESLDVVAAPASMDPALVRKGADGVTNVTCAVNITNPTIRCIPAPVVNAQSVGGNLPQDWINYTWKTVTGATKYKETLVSASVDGPLFELPAGKVVGAFGVEFRDAHIDDSPAVESVNSWLYNLTSSQPTRGEDSVWEAFGEVEVPILADLPFADELTVNLSARYTDYDSYGADWTHKVAGVYSPFSWASLRASYGTSFRAPALFEQFLGATTGFAQATVDPCTPGGLGASDPVVIANCLAEVGPGFTQTSGITIYGGGGAAQGLKAETSENVTFGLILQPELPSAFGKLDVAIDYFEVDIRNGVNRIGSNNLMSLCYSDPNFRGAGSEGWCRYVTRDTGKKLTIYDSYTNVSRQYVEGIDYNVRWSREVGPGDLRITAGVTQYLSQASATFEDTPLIESNGSLTSPEYTGTLDASYKLDRWTFRYGAEWVGAQDSAFRRPATVPGFPTVKWTDVYDVSVPDYFLHHLSVRYKADDWSAIVGVRNVFDEEPPTISADGRTNRIGNAPLYSGYDYVGRSFFVNLAKKF
ncbi:TonB-dependent receptor [Caulobacter sp. 17J65-9]|nr:TonB-dependent receptor [Caulobacter sp. 17J65-9]